MPDFRSLKDGYHKDSDYPQRAHDLLALARVLDGKLYHELKNAFSEEKRDSGEYIPLKDRRPAVRTRFCPTVVNDSVSMLFSEGHFPDVECKDEKTRDALTTVIKEACLNAVMIEAATRGSVGSICVLMRVLQARVFVTVMQTPYMTPEWDENAPDTLKKVVERYKAKGDVLKAAGYTIADDDLDKEFWFQRVWDENAENWYLPQTKEDAKAGKAPVLDYKRTVKHSLGFVPMVWVKNLPCGENDIDGAPTFPAEAIDTQIEADYLLSQGGRGLKYQSDPVLHIKEPAFSGNGPVVKGAANAIITGAEGDAKLLEINGDAASAVMDWVKALREIALEGMGGNRSNADKLSAAQSGRAMELMNQSLIWLADKLRISYGEGALLELLCMIVRASSKFPLKDKRGRPIEKMSQEEDISLRWPAWYPPTYADKATQATTLDELRGGGLISQETAVKSIADSYDIEDVAKELAAIKSDAPPPNSAAAKPLKPALTDSQD
jgi:Phage portal protein, SPP1 Gp6-like